MDDFGCKMNIHELIEVPLSFELGNKEVGGALRNKGVGVAL